MKPSKYKDTLGASMEAACLSPERDLILVELPAKEEIKTASGLIVPDNSKNQINTLGSGGPVFVHAICIGKGYTDDEGKPDPLLTRAGDILLVSPHSIEWFEQFPGLPLDNLNETKIGLIKENAIQINFGQPDKLRQLEGILKGAL